MAHGRFSANHFRGPWGTVRHHPPDFVPHHSLTPSGERS